VTTTASTTRIPIIAGAVLAGILAVVVPSASASAHTETDFVAVPAAATATVTFEPEHGCGESPTVEVRIQAPVLGAVAEDVAGWTATATPDGSGNTVLRWTGGSTPADEAGAFPVEFTVPDTPGVLLAFPAVQTCEDGQELAWIGTTPGDEFPAPSLLVLPAGAEPAATIDDVPADAPGRDQLVALAEA
jgi:periplasmic copper chaperone A